MATRLSPRLGRSARVVSVLAGAGAVIAFGASPASAYQCAALISPSTATAGSTVTVTASDLAPGSALEVSASCLTKTETRTVGANGSVVVPVVLSSSPCILNLKNISVDGTVTVPCSPVEVKAQQIPNNPTTTVAPTPTTVAPAGTVVTNAPAPSPTTATTSAATTTTKAPAVAGVEVSNSGDSLPRTGLEIGGLVLVGGALVAAGMVLSAGSRRRHNAD